MRVNITLECTECHEQTYLTNKNKRNNQIVLNLRSTAHAITRLLYIVKQNNNRFKTLLFFFESLMNRLHKGKTAAVVCAKIG